jgi:hypothetical protein
MATKKAPPKKTATSKTQARTQDSSKLEFSAEATTHPSETDENLRAAEKQRAALQQPGRVSKADAQQIDNDPGYDKDQLAHMREYWGLDPVESAVEAEEGQLVEEAV